MKLARENWSGDIRQDARMLHDETRASMTRSARWKPWWQQYKSWTRKRVGRAQFVMGVSSGSGYLDGW